MSKSPSFYAALAAAAALAAPAHAQSVISAHSGVVHFFEGAVYLDGQALQSRVGKYPSMPLGSRLRTEDGRAEVLLTPGVFLRTGDHSEIHLVANDLGDTQVEVSAGNVIVDAAEPGPDTSVTLIYSRWRVHILQQGVYRLDSKPAVLYVHEGRAEVRAGTAGTPLTIEQGSSLPFAEVLVADKSQAEPVDSLSDWSKGRGQSIQADDAITAQIDEDPASKTLTADNFTYFPMLGLLPPDPRLFGSLMGPSQLGFSSIYLPGYTNLPFLFAPTAGIRTYVNSPLRMTGVPTIRTPGSIFVPFSPRPVIGVVPRPVTRPMVPRPAPVAHPIAVPHVGVHK